MGSSKKSDSKSKTTVKPLKSKSDGKSAKNAAGVKGGFIRVDRPRPKP